jgi:hypothetical protein
MELYSETREPLSQLRTCYRHGTNIRFGLNDLELSVDYVCSVECSLDLVDASGQSDDQVTPRICLGVIIRRVNNPRFRALYTVLHPDFVNSGVGWV